MAARATCRAAGFFRVRQIEVTGASHLGVDTVLAALALDTAASVCDDLTAVEGRLAAVPGVAGVSVGRRLPGTITVRVREVAPVAFVPRARGLAVVDREGRELPYDPTLAPLDLPVAAEAEPALLSVLARIQAVEPALADQITEARLTRQAAILELADTRLLLPPEASDEVIRAVALVSADLEARGRAYRELDARFAGQVVVRTAGGR